MYIKYENIEDKIAKRLDDLFGVKDCLIEVNPGNVILPPKYRDLGERILNMEVRPDDIWLVSYPRTGSTWAQEMVWCICNNLDFERAKSMLGQSRNPLLELTALMGNDTSKLNEQLGNSVEQVENMPSPRFIKTHLPSQLLPQKLSIVKPKIIYVARNPKDMCVSYYHYCKLIHGLHGSFDEFCELFIKGKTPIGPIWNHILRFWEKRDETNLLFLKYEDMKKNLKGAIRQVASFLAKELTEEQVLALEDHLSFNNMRKNPALNLKPILAIMEKSEGSEDNPDEQFIRKGKVGDWKNYMSEELSVKFDKFTEDNLRGTGLTFETS
ncbi:sulfotransferase 1B1 [Daktulosphaira vitifoliae]|uniref:sulfotransferase 1B1 n=1 Tax=Daktulosphaira vitifoliae TaxID=58002 RepID=UPI0021AA3FE5|nr:sulfotransferase 1B1 [Daktulosphaira vitifoliae]